MHKHFKMSDESSHHIFNHHHKIAIFIAVFVTIILCVIILIQLNLKQENNQQIKQTEQIATEQKKVELQNNYENEVKTILNNYLNLRIAEEFDCKSEVSSTVNKILNLVVPVEYKKFHLELVVLLDKENANCETGFDVLDNEWELFLKKYEWLNYN